MTSKKTQRRFWVSWVCEEEDYRPLAYPPNPRILGWWCSGEDANGNTVLCAAVEARDEEAARDAIYADWPEAERTTDTIGWRIFGEIETPDWRPGDRFPLSDWMISRFDSDTITDDAGEG